MSQLIPVQSGTHVTEHLTVDYLEQHPGHYRIKRNKRGNVTRAFVRQRDLPLVEMSCAGFAFRETLITDDVVTARLWALQGVELERKSHRRAASRYVPTGTSDGFLRDALKFSIPQVEGS